MKIIDEASCSDNVYVVRGSLFFVGLLSADYRVCVVLITDNTFTFCYLLSIVQVLCVAAMESKREEFRKYLEKGGALQALNYGKFHYHS